MGMRDTSLKHVSASAPALLLPVPLEASMSPFSFATDLLNQQSSSVGGVVGVSTGDSDVKQHEIVKEYNAVMGRMAETEALVGEQLQVRSCIPVACSCCVLECAT